MEIEPQSTKMNHIIPAKQLLDSIENLLNIKIKVISITPLDNSVFKPNTERFRLKIQVNTDSDLATYEFDEVFIASYNVTLIDKMKKVIMNKSYMTKENPRLYVFVLTIVQMILNDKCQSITVSLGDITQSIISSLYNKEKSTQLLTKIDEENLTLAKSMLHTFFEKIGNNYDPSATNR